VKQCIYDCGDWVAFLQNGVIKYAKVEYVHLDEVLQEYSLVTTEGMCPHDSVLEFRRR
jgi:hypothetical protein